VFDLVKIKSVTKGSLADKKGIRQGETLIQINSHPIRDVLDYRFFLCEKSLVLEIQSLEGDLREVKIKKGEYDDIGLEFDTFLMDKQESCRNKCIFCFIDQNPHSMRESIYFKDDDTRLAFLFGNYVTLTNVDDKELDRLISMHISPINVSVQATNPELRQMMLNNRFAGKILDQMERLKNGGIDLNAQIVLCKGVNDKKELERTLLDLERLTPNLKSISVVPVGLTKHRRGLYPLEPFTAEDCEEIIDYLEKMGENYLEKYKTRLVYPSDEFYIKAGRKLPESEFYEDFLQLENGVGMVASFIDEVDFYLEGMEENPLKKTVSIATGYASFDTIRQAVEKINKIWYNIDCKVYPIRNDFYGESVTVSGLLTGQDIINQLRGKVLGDLLLLPGNALRYEDNKFLDDVTLSDVERELGVKTVVTSDGGSFVEGIIS